MPWNPNLAATDISLIWPNLRAWIEANQVDALSWANGGAGLDPFAQIYNSAAGRAHTVWPDLMVTGDAAKTDYGDEGLMVSYGLALVMRLVDPDPDVLIAKGKKYLRAVESMIVNCPVATLLNGVDAEQATLLEVEVEPSILGESESVYLQVTRLRVSWAILQNGYV